MSTAVFEIENPYPGRVTFLSACQAVALHLGSIAEPRGPEGSLLLPKMWIRGVNDQREPASMILDRVAAAQEGMPFHDQAESLEANETVELKCLEPYKSIAISGDKATILGPRGEVLSNWAEALMLVCFKMSVAMRFGSRVTFN